MDKVVTKCDRCEKEIDRFEDTYIEIKVTGNGAITGHFLLPAMHFCADCALTFAAGNDQSPKSLRDYIFSTKSIKYLDFDK